ncbi:hypothetical protein BpHYR1_010936 [Brachionus plicatilis]|uniref:Uncharacterized protein n=1 Tax=Brachionus plicatilis TaxID=10195 RepID=A0A3M7P6V8_BRAPC|nr:hypothetical protein BpHYR1_010936 [Brachionus plicatilis]
MGRRDFVTPPKKINADLNEKNFIDLLKRAQNYSLEDQRGRIDSRHLQIPEFLLTSSNLIKSQSMTQNLGKFSFELNTLSNYNDSVNDCQYQTNNSFDYNLIYQQNNLLGMQGINKSSVSLPVESNYTALPVRYQTIRNTITTTANRTRSPVMIVYDNEDYQDIDYVCENRHDLSDKLNDTPMNYESISETNSPAKLNSNLSNTSFTQDNSRISYVKKNCFSITILFLLEYEKSREEKVYLNIEKTRGTKFSWA